MQKRFAFIAASLLGNRVIHINKQSISTIASLLDKRLVHKATTTRRHGSE
jgi:hypothetical protein